MANWIDFEKIREITDVLETRQKRKLYFLSAIQVALSVLDLLGVAVFGVLGALTVTGVQSSAPTQRVQQILSVLHIENFTFQTQSAILGILAVSLLVLRTALTVLITKKTFRFLSNRGAEVSSQLIRGLLGKPILFIQSKSSQELLYGVTQGVMTMVIGVVATLTNLIADAALLIILGVAMYLVDPLIAFSSLMIFGAVSVILYKVLHEKARKLGVQDSTLQIQGNSKIIEVLQTYRESVVHDRRDFYADEIGKIRIALARTQAEASFLPYVSKYVIESTVIVGSLIIAGIQFAIHDAVKAAATLSVFMIAGTRISPAVLRIQQGLIQIKASIGGSSPTLELLRTIPLEKNAENASKLPNFNYSDDFTPAINVKNVGFRYPNSPSQAIKNLNLSISPGSVVAIVGPSGGGKSTLVDLLLGVLTPDTGEITISAIDPIQAIKKFPGAISYVPQQVVVVDGTIRENISLGYSAENFFDEEVLAVLSKAGLEDFVSNIPGGLNSPLGEWGTRISGGQRQRIGIARALFTNPKLLVLDEATSALDGETESGISTQILKMKGQMTVVMIAHRLSTVIDADRIYYVDAGEIKAEGTFHEVRSAVPEFDRQAKLMGL
jgi:ABC-type multidrug transport system fused ATPase/permease subunit